MNFPFYIARRYLFSKKSHNAINIISMVSVCGVVVATMALVCALSVLNGFVGLVSSMLGNFDPELKIQPVHGKVFDPTLPAVREVKVLPEVALFCEVLQDNAQVRYRDRQITATVKGVDDTFGRLTRIDSILVDSRDVPLSCPTKWPITPTWVSERLFLWGCALIMPILWKFTLPRGMKKSISPTLSPP